ncbi:MAG: iron ABC transporter [Blastopirellula sp.]|nr:MAG: iron ABC transporter [Blastopirellula sp.]
MSERVILAHFEHEDDLLAATNAVRLEGLQIVDVFTPYAVHGLDKAMGLKPSRLTWVCFVCGMVGGLGMLWFEHWSASISWAINVGGKPWNSLPSDVPVAFEAAILLAGFGSVFALFAVCKLYPGKHIRMISPRVTDDQFVLVINEANASFDLSAVQDLLHKYDVVAIEEKLL